MKIKGGDKFEAVLKDIAGKLGGKGVLQVGFLSGATYPDGTSVPMVAAIQEFGAPRAGIPPRPFFRNMIAEKSGEWPEAIGKKLVETEYDVKETLEVSGEGIRGQLQQSIIDTNSPALSPVTIMLRGMRANDPNLKVTGATVGEAAQRVKDGKTSYGASDKPLVDSGDMLNSVDFIVKS